jgi:hypothetical protein
MKNIFLALFTFLLLIEGSIGQAYVITSDSSICSGSMVTFSANIAPVAGAVQIGSFYGGGVVGYIYQPGDQRYVDGQTHGIIAALSDQNTGLAWGCYGQAIGFTSNAIGLGLNNTNAIVAGCDGAGYAALLCYNLDLNGFTDWHLPSLNELQQIYNNRTLIDSTALANGGSNLTYTAGYWSSSEFSAGNAWSIYFGSGLAYASSKNDGYAVRAIRSF